MNLRPSAVCALPLLCVLASAGEVDQWSQFRGPNGSGVDSAGGYPAEFSPAKNVVWKAAVPFGRSSPVLAGNHVYLTASEGNRLLTLCLDVKTGREVWRREVKPVHAHKLYKANDAASPTPVADAGGVVSFFADFGLVAYSAEGKQLWTVPLGPFKNFYGMASSPVLAGEQVILVCDQNSGSFLLGIDRKTGRQRWKTPRTGSPIGWATPMVFRPGDGPAQIIVLGSTRLDSYYLETGEPRWWMPVASMGGLGVPVATGNSLLVATIASAEPWMPTFDSQAQLHDKDKDGRLSRAEFQGDPDLGEHFGWLDADSDDFVTAVEWNEARSMGEGEFGAFALQPGNRQGKIESAQARWRFKKNLPYVPAPLIYQGVYYMVRTGGVITALNPATGELLKEGRTREALGEYFASPVAADGKVYLASEEGKITVLKAGADWQVLGVNELGEEVYSTPALSQGRLYARTRGRLYCFGTGR